MRFRQDHLAPAFEKPEQPLAIAHGQVCRFLKQRVCRGECLLVALLLVTGAQFPIHLATFYTEFFHGGFRFLLEPGFTAVDVIEAARDLAGKFDVRNLVFADRHAIGAVDQDVRSLQQWIAEEAVGREIFLGQLFLLVLVSRHPFEPAQWRDHGEQQVQFRMFRNLRLDEQRGL